MLKKFIPDKLIQNNSPIHKDKILDCPLIALYFSALWCPPCVGFHPLILDFYKKVNENEKVFEVIFCSLDEDEEDFKEYLKKLPFAAIDYNDPKLEDLTAAFEVEGIPMLVVFDNKGNLIDPEGRTAIQGKKKLSPSEQINKWLEKSKSKNND